MVMIGELVRHTRLTPDKKIVGWVSELLGSEAAKVRVDHSQSKWPKVSFVICAVKNLESVEPCADTIAPAAYYDGLMKIIDELG